jgi:ATP-binding cassette, subfamily F, member 3
MTVAPGLKVSIFAQHQLDDLRPEENARRACAPL